MKSCRKLNVVMLINYLSLIKTCSVVVGWVSYYTIVPAAVPFNYTSKSHLWIYLNL